jgi:hypothetical protein
MAISPDSRRVRHAALDGFEWGVVMNHFTVDRKRARIWLIYAEEDAGGFCAA